MENNNIFSKQKFIEDAKRRGDKILVFDNHGSAAFDTDGFDYTMVTGAILLIDNKVVPLEKINTWASLLRSVNNATKENRDKIDVAEESFNDMIHTVTEKYGLGMNQNFSMRLYTDDSFIKSSVYKNNQNHALKVWRDKKICAVYSGEVVVVLNAIIASTGDPDYDEKAELLVSYRKRYEDTQKIYGLQNGIKFFNEKKLNQLEKETISKVEQKINSDMRKKEMIYQASLKMMGISNEEKQQYLTGMKKFISTDDKNFNKSMLFMTKCNLLEICSELMELEEKVSKKLREVSIQLKILEDCINNKEGKENE